MNSFVNNQTARTQVAGKGQKMKKGKSGGMISKGQPTGRKTASGGCCK